MLIRAARASPVVTNKIFTLASAFGSHYMLADIGVSLISTNAAGELRRFSLIFVSAEYLTNTIMMQISLALIFFNIIYADDGVTAPFVASRLGWKKIEQPQADWCDNTTLLSSLGVHFK